MRSSDVKHLSDLAYITIPEKQQSTYEKDFKGILSHIDTLKEVTEQADTLPSYYHQTLREDIIQNPNPHYPTDIRERILESMPETQGSALVVKAVLKK